MREELVFKLDGLRRGHTASLVSPAWVRVAGGKVFYAGGGPVEVHEGARVLEGGYLCEPLADAHVHLFLCGSLDERERERTRVLGRDDALSRILYLLKRYRRQGVAVVRDGGDPNGLALEAAAIANAEPATYAAVRPSGIPLHRKGRYGDFLGEGVQDLAGALSLIDQNVKNGATQIKLLATGINSLDRAGGYGEAQFTEREVRELVGHARSLGVGVMAHANGPVGWLASAGVDSVEHGFYAGRDGLAGMARHRTCWLPTLEAWAALAGYPGLSPKQKDVVRCTHAAHLQEVGAGFGAGVMIATGSDAGTPGVLHGTGLVSELGRLVEAGLDGQAALAASTRRARTLCEGGDVESGLYEGAEAAFVWTRKDPALDPATLLTPLGVMLGGEFTSN